VTSPQSPVPPCAHVAAAGKHCGTEGCGHAEELHDIRDRDKTRTVCSYSSGPKATPCGCTRFTELEVTD